MQSFALGSAAIALGCDCGPREAATLRPAQPSPPEVLNLYPAQASPSHRIDEVTPENIAATYNNFYEFTTDKARVHELAAGFRTRPWQVEVTGLVDTPTTFDIDDLVRRFPLEERTYRFRCVEAWAMVVPWTGFPLARLLEAVGVQSGARYVRMVTANDPEQMPGIRSQGWYPWPYHEGLRLDEAMNDLTLLATGIYGHELPPQHGAPIRLVVPWKYGFKNIKSIVKIELVAEEPPTFWHTLAASEYGFYGNVDPGTPHPRWSQASERRIDDGSRQPTLVYNGYEEQVASLYPGGPSATP